MNRQEIKGKSKKKFSTGGKNDYILQLRSSNTRLISSHVPKLFQILHSREVKERVKNKKIPTVQHCRDFYMRSTLPFLDRRERLDFLMDRKNLLFNYNFYSFVANFYNYDTSRYSDCSIVRSSNCLSNRLT